MCTIEVERVPILSHVTDVNSRRSCFGEMYVESCTICVLSQLLTISLKLVCSTLTSERSVEDFEDESKPKKMHNSGVARQRR